jgi:hypothetical protein
MPHNTDASASVLGYLYQCRLALLTGIRAYRLTPALELSIERFDDIALGQAGKISTSIQAKHHIKAGDLSDMSVDLWKTLGIWIHRLKADPTASLDTQFTIITTASAKDDSAAALLRSGRSESDIGLAIDKLLLAANNSGNQETAAARQNFENLNPIERLNLVRRIFIYDNAPNITNVRAEIDEICWTAAPEGKISAFVDYLEGWWLNQVIEALTTAGGSIPVQLIRSKIDELRESFMTGGLPLDEDIVEALFELPDAEQKLFVKQLRLIDVSDSVIVRSIRDYYRTSEMRSKWAREKLLLDGDSDRYDRSLIDRWERKFEEKKDEYAPLDNDEKKRTCGRTVFHWANTTPFPLRNRSEQWLSAGSYHILADQLRLGWHPEYSSVLVESGEPVDA